LDAKNLRYTIYDIRFGFINAKTPRTQRRKVRRARSDAPYLRARVRHGRWTRIPSREAQGAGREAGRLKGAQGFNHEILESHEGRCFGVSVNRCFGGAGSAIKQKAEIWKADPPTSDFRLHPISARQVGAARNRNQIFNHEIRNAGTGPKNLRYTKRLTISGLRSPVPPKFSSWNMNNQGTKQQRPAGTQKSVARISSPAG